jgi:hypothetical protein
VDPNVELAMVKNPKFNRNKILLWFKIPKYHKPVKIMLDNARFRRLILKLMTYNNCQ